ncbi:hypothetical protein N9P43_02555 [Planktomarina temperata]|nr:hypothetical protein [Planktomarina temperata]MDA9255254.1 hypothetical protein [Planktomarina temperata]MDB9802926.1 hypothetical protein [Planktomarina temperata]MDB9839456.1 hypothetical protein [Planktomarina temperata]MDC1468503.1 hypothetical protein [Planktomarina temperata]
MANANLSPNRLIIEQFIRAVTQNWLKAEEDEHNFEVRCLGENRTPNSRLFAPSQIGDATAFIIKMNDLKMNVYMTINPINAMLHGNATDDDVACAHLSFADADDLTGLAGIKTMIGEHAPDFIVTTGSVPCERQHAYWRLEAPCHDLELWKQSQQKIARNLGTDPSVINPSRIMRVAGTVSYPSQSKVAKGYIPELVTFISEVS